jgi:hypothetical protein
MTSFAKTSLLRFASPFALSPTSTSRLPKTTDHVRLWSVLLSQNQHASANWSPRGFLSSEGGEAATKRTMPGVPRRPGLAAACTAVRGPCFDRDAHSSRCGVKIAVRQSGTFSELLP